MDTVHDSQAFIYHHLNMLERPSTPGTSNFLGKVVVIFDYFNCEVFFATAYFHTYSVSKCLMLLEFQEVCKGGIKNISLGFSRSVYIFTHI